MSVCSINTVILSGELSHISIKYTSKQEQYANFAIKQSTYLFQSYDFIFASCFNQKLWSDGRFKEGAFVTVQGKLQSYTSKRNEFKINFVVEKIDINS